MKEYSYYIVGLPSTGKTTFLAALYYFLINNQGKDYAFRLKRIVGNSSYLGEISKRWAEFDKALRTPLTGDIKETELELEDQMGNIVRAKFPDLSGENFERMINDRIITKENRDSIVNSDKIFLFINPEEIDIGLLIKKIDKEYRKEKGNIIDMGRKINIPTQTKLVELLQFIEFIKKEVQINLDIIISAWDVIDNSKYNNPIEFIEAKLPLLWQYIFSNSKTFNINYWGISAQGGDLDDQDTKEKLADLICAEERIRVVDKNGNSINDITVPFLISEGE